MSTNTGESVATAVVSNSFEASQEVVERVECVAPDAVDSRLRRWSRMNVRVCARCNNGEGIGRERWECASCCCVCMYVCMTMMVPSAKRSALLLVVFVLVLAKEHVAGAGNEYEWSSEEAV